MDDEMCNVDEIDQVMKFQNMNENDHHLYICLILCVKPRYLSFYFLTK